MMKKLIRPVVKIHGGKRYLAKWIISLFPPNYQKMVYLEPFCGAGSVFLNKEASIEEAICDIDRGIINIFWALRDEPKEFIGRLKRVKYNENTCNRAQKKLELVSDDYLESAVN